MSRSGSHVSLLWTRGKEGGSPKKGWEDEKKEKNGKVKKEGRERGREGGRKQGGRRKNKEIGMATTDSYKPHT